MRAKWFILLLPLLVLVWLYNASKPGHTAEGCFSGCADPRKTQGNNLRIISLNMLHGYPRFENLPQRLELIAQEINRLDADVVLLQEVPWTYKTGNGARYLAEATRMNFVYQRANGNRWAILFEEGEAILSRYPLTHLESQELLPREGIFKHRVILHAIVLTHMGDVDLYVTHLTNGEASLNIQQSKHLVNFVQSPMGAFAVIAGDFNAKPNSPQIQELPSDWIDTYPAANLIGNGYTCCVENLLREDATLKKRIDYIFLLPSELDVIIHSAKLVFNQPYDFRGEWLWVSDHLGLMIDLVKGSQESP